MAPERDPRDGSGARREDQGQNAKVAFHVSERCERSVQVEQQHLRRLRGHEPHVGFVGDRRGIARLERVAVELHFAFGHMHPGMTARLQRVRDFVARLQFGQAQVGILVDGEGTLAPGFGYHEVEPAFGASAKDFSA